MSDIQKLSPITYHWNDISGMDTINPYSGFSAQNMQTAIPEAVATDTRGYLTLSDRPILAALVNAFKDLGASVVDGITHFAKLAVNTLTATTATFGTANASTTNATTANASTTNTGTTNTTKLCVSDGAGDNAPACFTKSQLLQMAELAGLTTPALANPPLPAAGTSTPPELLSAAPIAPTSTPTTTPATTSADLPGSTSASSEMLLPSASSTESNSTPNSPN